MHLIEQEKLLLLAEKAELEARIAPALQRINQINAILKKEDRINWNEKVLHCLNYVQRPLTTEDILTHIFYKKENAISNLKERRAYILKISLSLLRLCEKGIVCSEQVDNRYRGKIYLLPEWLEQPNYENVLNTKKRTLIEKKIRLQTFM